MKRYKELYITEILICIIYVLLKFVIVNCYLFLNSYFDAIYFFIIFIYFYFKYEIARDKNYYTKISVRYIIIFLLSYVLIYLMVYLLRVLVHFIIYFSLCV